ncbi:uncharacterized protein LOC141629674 [Silene latifolia]|uniref:uncharacterized protein LOC141629674 n=1 Tax=Silene latifolia TaxID=37657 RepID=UPI003D777172
MKEFNQALLAKLGWRMITHPDSILCKSIGAKYGLKWRDGDLLFNDGKSNSSWGWKGIVWGLQLIKPHLAWNFSPFSDLGVWNTKWVHGTVPRPRCVELLIDSPNLCNLRIKDLICNSNRWDYRLVSMSFDETSTKDILAIPIRCSDGSDNFYWSASSSGNYSVKIGYHIALQNLWNISASPKDRSRVSAASLSTEDGKPGFIAFQTPMEEDLTNLRNGVPFPLIQSSLIACRFCSSLWDFYCIIYRVKEELRPTMRIRVPKKTCIHRLHIKGIKDAFRQLDGILKRFCEASGQTINYEKSGIIFSPSTPIKCRASWDLKSLTSGITRALVSIWVYPRILKAQKQIFSPRLLTMLRSGSPRGMGSSVLSTISSYFLSVFKIPVKDLLLGPGEWNKELITELFSEEWRSKILALPLCSSQPTDTIFWKHTTSADNGEFLVISLIATIWCIWCTRNNLVFRGDSFSPETFYNLQSKTTAEAIAAYEATQGMVRAKGFFPGLQRNEVREKLENSFQVYLIGTGRGCNTIRVKVDAGWHTSLVSAAGWVAYDHDVSIIFEGGRSFWSESALQAEAKGIREALRWASANGIFHLDVFSDCLQILLQITGVENGHHLTQGILLDIEASLPFFHCISFSFIPINLNSVAHRLAKRAMRL